MALAAYTDACDLNKGGNKKLYIIAANAVDTNPFGAPTAGVISSLNASNSFLEIECEIDTIERRESSVVSENHTVQVTHEIEFEIHKTNIVAREALQAILDEPCGVIAIVEDQNGLKFISGYSVAHKGDRGLRVSSGDGTSGKAFSDTNGYTFVLQSVDDSMDLSTDDDPSSPS